jgi:hypothetical protein
MGFFKDLKFGGGSIGLFDNSKFSPGNLLDLVKEGTFRTEGTFAPGYKNDLLLNPTDYLKGQAKPEDGNPNTNKAAEWSPTLSIKAMSVRSEGLSSKRYEPGFLPPAYLSKQIFDKNIGKGKINEYSWNEDNAWIGHLLNSHIESPYYRQFEDGNPSLETSKRIDEATVERTQDEPYSARDYYIRFNDQNTDYFRHGLHIEGLTKIKTGKNARESWNGSGDSFRLASFKESQHENNDPVIFGFDIIFDSINSPLLNGSVEDFISEFSYVSEVASRAIVIDDFKRQFMKIFKTKGNLDSVYKEEYESDNIMINNQRQGQVMASNAKSNIYTYANAQGQTNLYRVGKRAYMGYYLQKVDGLSNLSESNTGDKKKYLADYKKDVIKMTFLEDLSLTMGTLAHLYKLLYWSKPNGKNIIPENLLRFNCDIVISECRNFNRVRKAAKTGDLEILKDNVSRYIYSLRECQFWFDKMSHEDSIDMGNLKTTDTFEVMFDYKYSTVKLEKWVPDPEKFGRYVGYNNGAIWKIGNKGSRASRSADGTTAEGKFVMKDNSVPKFYTINTNTIRHNGVTQEIIMEAYKVTPDTEDDTAKVPDPSPAGEAAVTAPAPAKSAGDSVGEDEEDKTKKKENRKKKAKEALEQFKKNAKKAAVGIAKGAAKFVFDEVNNQITIRAKLLEDTINKARNLMGMGGLKTEPKRVYPRPYTPNSLGIFFDVRNELFNFLGNEVAGVIAGGMQSLLPGTQISVPFTPPNIGATLDKLTKGFSLYDAEAKLIASMKSKGPQVPFFDSTKHSKKFAGQTTNKIYNTNTTFKFPATTEIVKFGGGFGVKALDFMKPKGNIYSDGKNKPAMMIDKYSNPLSNKFPVGTKDYNKIGFPNPAQKYPAPLIQGTSNLKDILKNNTVLKFPMDSIQFPTSGQKEPAPVSKGTGTLKDLLANSEWKDVPGSMSNLQFPDSGQKFQSPVTAGNSTLKDLNAKSVWASTPGMMSAVQFPTAGHKYPAPVKTGISDLKTLLASSKWNNVPGADKMSNLQFPNSAQKHLSPVTTANSTLDQIVKSKSVVGSYGNSSYSNIQFPKAPQKFPSPVSTGSKDLEQIVKSGTKWEYPVNNKKFGA